MKRVAMLISHIPNPRILKRIQVLENEFEITLLYWDRDLEIKESFEINGKNSVESILVKAPQGKPFNRIIPLLKFAYIAINHLSGIKPDIIHAANLDMLFVANIYLVIFNRGTKIVYEVGDLPKYSFIKKINSPKAILAKLLQYIEKRLTCRVSKIILTSPYFWLEYFSKFIQDDKYLFIPNAPLKKVFNKYEKKYHDIFTIGFIGSVRYGDQLKMLIDVAEEIGNLKVLIAGSGPEYQEIKEYTKNKDFVEIYGPYNYEKEIVSLYEIIDCTYAVYNTKFSNVKVALPNRLYESIVCEIPIIGTKRTVLGKFIEENQIGVNINDDKIELKDALLKLINSPKLMEYYQENCKKIKSNYYYENNSELLLTQYTKIANY
ncbi:MAG: glycosyltransferase [Tissierellia bacterium]|nr:glycosyltransferase [Tissierellia bacterium]